MKLNKKGLHSSIIYNTYKIFPKIFLYILSMYRLFSILFNTEGGTGNFNGGTLFHLLFFTLPVKNVFYYLLSFLNQRYKLLLSLGGLQWLQNIYTPPNLKSDEDSVDLPRTGKDRERRIFGPEKEVFKSDMMWVLDLYSVRFTDFGSRFLSAWGRSKSLLGPRGPITFGFRVEEPEVGRSKRLNRSWFCRNFSPSFSSGDGVKIHFRISSLILYEVP